MVEVHQATTQQYAARDSVAVVPTIVVGLVVGGKAAEKQLTSVAKRRQSLAALPQPGPAPAAASSSSSIVAVASSSAGIDEYIHAHADDAGGSEQSRTLRQAFEEAADAGGGRLSRAAFEAKLSELRLFRGRGELRRRLFSSLDTDGSGTVEAAELAHGFRVLGGGRAGASAASDASAAHDATGAKLGFCFRMYDADDDGSITTSELSAMLRADVASSLVSLRRAVDFLKEEAEAFGDDVTAAELAALCPAGGGGCGGGGGGGGAGGAGAGAAGAGDGGFSGQATVVTSLGEGEAVLLELQWHGLAAVATTLTADQMLGGQGDAPVSTPLAPPLAAGGAAAACDGGGSAAAAAGGEAE